MTADSVTSITRSSGARPCAAISATMLTSVGSSHMATGKLKLIWSSMPRRRQSALSTHTCSMTHWVMGAMRPVRSASGMKWLGGIIGPSGGCQRISASTPLIAPVERSTTGW